MRGKQPIPDSTALNTVKNLKLIDLGKPNLSKIIPSE